MSQVLFSAATTPQLTDLDANFTALYDLREHIKTPGYAASTPWLTFSTGGANLGFGVTPSAWGTGFSMLEGAGGCAFGNQNGGSTMSTQNAYQNGTNWVYSATGAASQYAQNGGNHYWFVAVSGTAGAAISFKQAMTLDNNGNLLVGSTVYASAPNAGVCVNASGIVNIGNTAGTAGWGFETFNRSGVQIGSITQSGTTGVAYNTSSDYRLKDDVQPITGSGSFIDALKPCSWVWKSDGTSGAGFIAHELQAVSPGSVTGTKDATRPVGQIKNSQGAVVADGIAQPDGMSEGETWTQTGVAPIYQAVEYGSAEVIAMLVAELQAVRRRLHDLDGH